MQGCLLRSNDIQPPKAHACTGLGPSSHLLRGYVPDGTLRLRVGIGPSLFSPFKTRRTIGVEYSVMGWRTPIGEWKEVLYFLTFRREWMPERNCWREVVVKQERCKEY